MQRRYENIRLEHNGIMPRESNKKKKTEKNKMKVLMLAVFTVNHLAHCGGWWIRIERQTFFLVKGEKESLDISVTLKAV